MPLGRHEEHFRELLMLRVKNETSACFLLLAFPAKGDTGECRISLLFPPPVLALEQVITQTVSDLCCFLHGLPLIDEMSQVGNAAYLNDSKSKFRNLISG